MTSLLISPPSKFVPGPQKPDLETTATNAAKKSGGGAGLFFLLLFLGIASS